jgi:response regulator RpfG family c-di-GMP phosphodiesterase
MAKVTTTKALAARKSWQERAETWRDKINVSKLITRLEEFVSSYIAPKNYVLIPTNPGKLLSLTGISEEQYTKLVTASSNVVGIEMTQSQVKASQVLLDRVMPTLSASEIVHKKETVSPEELIKLMRDRYGDQVADRLARDYVPEESGRTPSHSSPELQQ